MKCRSLAGYTEYLRMRSGGKLRRLAARWCSEVLADQGQALLHPSGSGQPQPGHYAQHKSRPTKRALARCVCADVSVTERGCAYIPRAVAVDNLRVLSP